MKTLTEAGLKNWWLLVLGVFFCEKDHEHIITTPSQTGNLWIKCNIWRHYSLCNHIWQMLFLCHCLAQMWATAQKLWWDISHVGLFWKKLQMSRACNSARDLFPGRFHNTQSWKARVNRPPVTSSIKHLDLGMASFRFRQQAVVEIWMVPCWVGRTCNFWRSPKMGSAEKPWSGRLSIPKTPRLTEMDGDP